MVSEEGDKVILAGDAILGTNLADGELMLNYLHKGFEIEPVSNEEIKRIVAGEDRE